MTSVLVLSLSAACADPDRLVEADLGPIEAVLEEVVKTVWPGLVDQDGRRFVRLLNGFFDGEPTSYWFSGFAPRFTAEVFMFCREGATCPLDDTGVLDPSLAVGGPVFARVPGERGYSPYWVVRVVRVPADYEPDAIKSVFGIDNAVAEGRVRVETLVADHGGEVGVAEVLIHCLLVLAGTQLEGNGADLVGQPGMPSRTIPIQEGWHKQYRVQFYDFAPSEGIFGPDPESTGAQLMPSANIFVLFRDCAGGSAAMLCGKTSGGFPAVSERGVEDDLTGDGDKADTNNLIAAFPGVSPADPSDRPYSALWAVQVVRVLPERDADVDLIDTSGDQNRTDIKSVTTMREFVTQGLLAPPEPMSEEEAGDRIQGNDGKVFFNCPSQVPKS